MSTFNIMAWAVLVLIKSHIIRYSESGPLKSLILQTMDTLLLLLRLLSLAHELFLVTGTCSWNDAVSCNSDMTCHTPVHSRTPCLISQFLQLNILLEEDLSSFAEGVLLKDVFSFCIPIPCTDKSLAMSLNGLSVASAVWTTSITFSRVRSKILSNRSLVVASLMPNTLLSLIREFFKVLNSRQVKSSIHENSWCNVKGSTNRCF